VSQCGSGYRGRTVGVFAVVLNTNLQALVQTCGRVADVTSETELLRAWQQGAGVFRSYAGPSVAAIVTG